MRYPKGSLNRENYRDQATVYFVAASRLVAQSQMAQFECRASEIALGSEGRSLRSDCQGSISRADLPRRRGSRLARVLGRGMDRTPVGGQS